MGFVTRASVRRSIGLPTNRVRCSPVVFKVKIFQIAHRYSVCKLGFALDKFQNRSYHTLTLLTSKSQWGAIPYWMVIPMLRCERIAQAPPAVALVDLADDRMPTLWHVSDIIIQRS